MPQFASVALATVQHRLLHRGSEVPAISKGCLSESISSLYHRGKTSPTGADCCRSIPSRVPLFAILFPVLQDTVAGNQHLTKVCSSVSMVK